MLLFYGVVIVFIWSFLLCIFHICGGFINCKAPKFLSTLSIVLIVGIYLVYWHENNIHNIQHNARTCTHTCTLLNVLCHLADVL